MSPRSGIVDCHGAPVIIGWAAHEILYLAAAMTLPLEEHYDAFSDISAMCGRSFSAIRQQAYALARHRRKEALVRKVLGGKTAPQHKPVATMEPSGIKPPTPAQLMGRTASRSATTGM